MQGVGGGWGAAREGAGRRKNRQAGGWGQGSCRHQSRLLAACQAAAAPRAQHGPSLAPKLTQMPWLPTSTLSPGSTRLAMHCSMPACPDPEVHSVYFESVWKR